MTDCRRILVRMGERRIAMMAALLAATALVGTTLVIGGQVVEAKKEKAEGLVACPGKVGKYRLHRVDVSSDAREQLCSYTHPKRYNAGTVSLRVRWWPDVTGERERCDFRMPRLVPREGWEGDVWDTGSSVSKVEAVLHFIHEPSVSPGRAEGPLRQLIGVAEPLAHRCVPDVAATLDEGLSCPLRLPGDLIRSDWYEGSPQVIKSLGDPSKQSYDLHCTYVPAYTEDGDEVSVRLNWREGDPSKGSTCIPRTKRNESVVDSKYDTTSTRLGYHPVNVEISDAFAATRLGREFADRLAVAAAARTQPCPDAPGGLAPYEKGVAAASSADATGTTDIVLSGGPDAEPPSVGTTIEVPEDDQHQLVIGGPDGEVIREEFIGDRATIGGYGPLVTDADGNWSVLATVDVTTVPKPTPLPSPEPSPSPTATRTPTPTPEAPSPDPTTARVPPSPSPGPATSPAVAPTLVPEPTASPTPIPPPELIGVPEGIAAIVAELPPAGAGAVRNVSDHVAVLGEMLEEAESGEVTVPPSDIGTLRELLPDLVQEVWLTDGSIVVSTTDPVIGSILVKPVIGDDGLISVTLSQYQIATYHPVVRALVAALNGYVAERGGRFTSVSVTPEGLTVTAER